MDVAFYTLGCKLNQSETEALASHYNKLGFDLSNIESKADYFIINTCTVTSKSEQKARRVIRNLSREYPDSLVIVTGCYAQLAGDEPEQLAYNVVSVPQQYKSLLFDFADDLKKQNLTFPDIKSKKDFFEEHLVMEPQEAITPFRFNVEEYKFHSRAFLKIQDGCDNRCAYCRVPLARGNSISLDGDIILERMAALVNSGYREIVLTGVNISSYTWKDWELGMLIKKMLETSPEIRIRLSSLEPEKIDDKLVPYLDDPRICEHFHIPFQSGSDKILGAMRRRYSSAKVVKGVNLLRQIKPGAFFSGDCIVGFPGEEDEDFQFSRNLVESLNLAGLHVFQFSPRPGTRAFEMKNPVPERVRKERAGILSSIAEKSFFSYVENCKGSEVDVVLEKPLSTKGDRWLGLSGNYLKVNVEGIPWDGVKGKLMKVLILDPGKVSGAKFISYL